MVSIQSLHIYPVKSCRGIALQSAEVAATGFVHDREWMIVREDGRFITQREEPRLALLRTALTDEHLELRAPEGDLLRIALRSEGASTQVTCWGDRCAAFDAGQEAANWLQAYLGGPYRLVRFDARQRRRSDPRWTLGIDASSQFSDAFAWLVISQASLDELNTRLPQALPMNRFRPNIVLSGVAPYAEDRIDELVAGSVRLKLVKACTRCAITTTAQESGERNSDQPLRTLKQYRFSRELKGVLFGQNAILAAGFGGFLSVGQEFEVSWKTEAQPVFV